MGILRALVLGLVQGLGEFLPISSSAHLVFVPWLFRWPDPGLGFDVALHWGTLLAVLIYFRNDVWLLIRGFIHSLLPSTRDLKENIYQKLSWLLVIASVPGAIIGYLLESKAESVFRNPLHIAVTLGVFGVVLLAADQLSQKTKNLDRITPWDAFLIGCSQALAVVPGVSRSGSTIATGLGLGFKREDAARFSFLMSIPIIFGAGLVSIRHFHDGASSGELLVGFVTAAVFGFLSIKYMLRYLARHDYKIFTWYRLVAAVIVMAIAVWRK
ncbi:MAG TPA: undecaprenyl-diphosphatase UppP [Patescibacteria group bacterium]|nr:undecaprenyl-diphosphatase UppP [Patescibacteria group bacterium]